MGAYARSRLGAQTPPLLIFSTKRDSFLIFEGASQFADIAKEMMKDHLLWLPSKGLTPCLPFPAKSAAQFLVGQDLKRIDFIVPEEISGTALQDSDGFFCDEL